MAKYTKFEQMSRVGSRDPPPISDVSSPSLGPHARPSEAFLLGSSPPEARKLQKRESLSPPEAQNRYPEPARDTRRFYHTLLEHIDAKSNKKSISKKLLKIQNLHIFGTHSTLLQFKYL